jgi:phosphotransferase system IIB component
MNALLARAQVPDSEKVRQLAIKHNVTCLLSSNGSDLVLFAFGSNDAQDAQSRIDAVASGQQVAQMPNPLNKYIEP